MDEEAILIPYLASTYGGDIAVREDQQGNLRPEAAVYRVTLAPTEQRPPTYQVLKGVIHVHGKPQSFAERLWEWGASELISEMGF